MFEIRIAVLTLILAICPILHATTVTGKVANANMRAVSGATVEFQLIEMGHGTTPARAITLPDIKSSYRVTTHCDGSFRIRVTGNDVIKSVKTLWEVRIIAPGIYVGPYNFWVPGSKLDLHIQTPQGTVDPKLPRFYSGTDIPPFRYSFGCRIRRLFGAIR